MRRYRRRSANNLYLEKKTVITVAGIMSLTAAGLLLLSFFTKAGLLLAISENFFELFGLGTFLVPVILVEISLPLLGVKSRFGRLNVIGGSTSVLLTLIGLVTALSSNLGGVFGNALWSFTESLLTAIGAAFVLLSIFAISLVIAVNTSFYDAANTVLNLTKSITLLALRLKGKLRPKLQFVTKGVQPEEPRLPRRPARGQLELEETTILNSPRQSQIWEYPPLSLLTTGHGATANRGNLKQNVTTIEKTLESFGITAKVVEVNLGPTVTQYALEIPMGTKLSKILSLQNDLALALATSTGNVRIEAPIPGKSLVGIEIPNISPEMVSLKNVLSSDALRSNKSKTAVGLGLDVSGNIMVADLARMPHILIAGTTGSGKSVLLNALIATLLFRASPQEIKLILADPKRVELSEYNDIPHLLTPVIVDPDKILSSLKWAMGEMDRRYRLFHEAQVRNIAAYNEFSGFQALPYIIIIIDELHNLMEFAPVEVEDAICRIAAMARATGIHLVVATQRPSVDVITGLIKANIPCRVAFNVSSMVDSRVIIDQPGAEKLLGKGDMLYVPPDASKPMRIQGVFVSDTEIRNLIGFLKRSGPAPQYTEEVLQMPLGKVGSTTGEKDDLFDQAVQTVCQYDRASASLLQRRLRIGYARAARLIDELESAGIVGPGDGSKPRDVLVRNAQEYFQAREAQTQE